MRINVLILFYNKTGMESNIVGIRMLESWSVGIVRPDMGDFHEAYALFVPFIIASSFTVLNLFIAIIVDSMLTPHQHEATMRLTMSLKRCVMTAPRCRPKLFS